VIAFSTAFTRGLHHGILAAVHLPDNPDDVPTEILQILHENERSHAETLGRMRRAEWIGGRLAAKVGASALGVEIGPLLSDAHGAPITPKAVTLSISHKANLAIALVARRAHGDIGVDLEHIGRDRSHIAPKILLPVELEEIAHLSADRKWTAVLTRFALKEATYKALAPRLQRYIGFDEAVITDIENGAARIQLSLKSGPDPVKIEGRYDWMAEGLVTSVRVRWD
jgi:enterobactin synthetase component D